MGRRCFIVVVAILMGVIALDRAQAYDAIAVKDGATLRGTVRIRGTVPPDETIRLDKDMDYCGTEQKLGEYLTSESNLQNAVVWIDEIKKGKPLPEKPVEVTLRKCKAEPLVSVGFVGGKYLFENQDDILHTIQLKLGLAYQKKVSDRPLEAGATIYNLALPVKGLQIEKPIRKFHRYGKETGFIQIRSNAHNWIRGYIFIFDQPYAAVTDAHGSFTLDDLPAGEYLLKVWHEGFGIQEKKVTVKPGETREIEIEYSAPGDVSVQRPSRQGASDLGGPPALEVRETRFDFGSVPWGESVSHAYELVNQGAGPLEIVDLVPA